MNIKISKDERPIGRIPLFFGSTVEEIFDSGNRKRFLKKRKTLF
jgi:hypothetical protein